MSTVDLPIYHLASSYSDSGEWLRYQKEAFSKAGMDFYRWVCIASHAEKENVKIA